MIAHPDNLAVLRHMGGDLTAAEWADRLDLPLSQVLSILRRLRPRPALVACGCGCGLVIADRDERNRPRRYAANHYAFVLNRRKTLEAA